MLTGAGRCRTARPASEKRRSSEVWSAGGAGCGRRLLPGTDEEDEARHDAGGYGGGPGGGGGGPGGREGGGPGQLLGQGMKLLGQSPELSRLTDELRGRLLDAGKGAAVAIATRQ